VLDATLELVSRRGYDEVSVAEIATAAGVSKGSVFYNFDSKQFLLDVLVDELQSEIAQRLAERVDRSARPTPASVARGLAAYLVEVNRPRVRQVILVDGPQVLGWQRWREIDDTHFAAMTRGALTALASPTVAENMIDAATRLVLGAVMEAALDIARTTSVEAADVKIDHFTTTIEAMLHGVSTTLE
jgi:AcrR family transcriptional regulator